MPTRFDDILSAFDFANTDGPYDARAYICRETGKVYSHSEFDDELDEEDLEPDMKLPEDIDDTDKYIALPDRRELGLGKPLVLKFANEFMPDEYDKVRDIFSRRGAYPKFKHLLARANALETWYDFEKQATEHALREWCTLNDIAVTD
jgi:hypothetical protein